MKAIWMILIGSLSIVNIQAQNADNHPVEKKRAPWFVERFKVVVGGFVPVNNTNIQVGVKGGAAGTDIDFERDLGFNKTDITFLAGFQWRISRRSRINLSYYNIPRSSTHTLTRDITFNDNTYHVDASVKSYFNTAIYQFSYGYAIIAKPNFELGLMIGAHIVGGKAGISLNTANAGVETSNNFGFTAPLPDLGIWGGYAIDNKWAVNFEGDYLSLTIGDINGSIFAYNLLVNYRLTEKWGISVGYTGLNFKVNASKPKVEGDFKWSYNGPSLGLIYSFGKKSWIH